MKIGILTFNWAINYGAVLQLYALYSYLKNSDHDVYVLNYIPYELGKSYRPKILEKPLKIKSIAKKSLQKLIKHRQITKFDEFIAKNLNLTEEITKISDLDRLIQSFDLIVVGSDQVWNYDITKNYLEAYLLNGINCNKISYAASLGKKEINNEARILFEEALKDFDFISLREESSIECLKRIYDTDYKVCVDPIFLLNKDSWVNFARESNYSIYKKEYILIYMLEYNSNLINVCKYLSKKYKLSVVSIEIPMLSTQRMFNMNNIKKLNNVGPRDFVKLFLGSKYILTNSFHGTAFSLIFEKPFISFAHSNVNLRIKNLLKLYGLEDDQVSCEVKDFNLIENILSKSQDIYEIKNKKMNQLIEESKSYLNNAIISISKKVGLDHEK